MVNEAEFEKVWEQVKARDKRQEEWNALPPEEKERRRVL